MVIRGTCIKKFCLKKMLLFFVVIVVVVSLSKAIQYFFIVLKSFYAAYQSNVIYQPNAQLSLANKHVGVQAYHKTQKKVSFNIVMAQYHIPQQLYKGKPFTDMISNG